MKKKQWFEMPIIQSGVMETNNSYKNGPQYAVGVVSIMPAKLIQMNNSHHFIIRNFDSEVEAKADKLSYRYEHVNWRMAERNGEETVRIAQSMQMTDGVRWLYIYPWGLMALGWYGTEEYFPGILSRMKEVLVEIYGEIEFVDVPNREMFFPIGKQFEASEKLGVNIPI